MNTTSKTLGLVAVMSMLAVPAFAEGPHGKHRRHGRHKGALFMNLKLLERMADKINVNEDTLEAIKEKVYKGKKKAIAWEAELKTHRLDLHRELDAARPNRGRVMNLIEETGALKLKLKKHRVGLMLDVRSMLTPEQIKKMKKLRREFKAKHHRRRGDRKHKAGGRYLDKDDRGHGHDH
jgi:Spy/CpxP family protein refolding chaperone